MVCLAFYIMVGLCTNTIQNVWQYASQSMNVFVIFLCINLLLVVAAECDAMNCLV